MRDGELTYAQQLEMMANLNSWKARAEAAEAKLSEALEVMRDPASDCDVGRHLRARDDLLATADKLSALQVEGGFSSQTSPVGDGSLPVPSSTWVLYQARSLSSSKSEDAVGALAWNLTVAFRRWADGVGRAPRPTGQLRDEPEHPPTQGGTDAG